MAKRKPSPLQPIVTPSPEGRVARPAKPILTPGADRPKTAKMQSAKSSDDKPESASQDEAGSKAEPTKKKTESRS